MSSPGSSSWRPENELAPQASSSGATSAAKPKKETKKEKQQLKKLKQQQQKEQRQQQKQQKQELQKNSEKTVGGSKKKRLAPVPVRRLPRNQRPLVSSVAAQRKKAPLLGV